MPQVSLGVGFAVVFGPILRPAYRRDETVDEYDARTGHSDKRRDQEDRIARYTSITCAAAVFMVPVAFVAHLLMVILMANLHKVVSFVDYSFGGRVTPLFQGDSWFRWTVMLSMIFAVWWTWISVEGLKRNINEFDESSNCNVNACLSDRIIIDEIRLGYVVYGDKRLYLLDTDGNEITSSGFDASNDSSILCEYTPVCDFLASRWNVSENSGVAE